MRRNAKNRIGWPQVPSDNIEDPGISFGSFRLFPKARLLERDGAALHIGGRALDILLALVDRPGEVVSRAELISRVWPDVTVDEANLRVHVAALRKVLGDGREGARYIANVAGRGYCFVAPLSHSAAKRLSPPTEAGVANRLQKLPARSARMVGRDDVVGAVSAQLMTSRFVSIVGSGGIGKTTVAISVAHALFDRFGGAVYFVDLDALIDPQLVPTAVASALGLMVQSRDPLPNLLTYLGDNKILLVLDNCEHVIDVAASLAERLVSEAPQAHVLATSREALRAEGEHVQLLYALDCPPEGSGITSAEALGYAAVQLFMERAAASGHGSELRDADAPIVASICRRLDGVALAIELAASRAGPLGIPGTAELLGNRFGMLWRGRRTAAPRHQTLNGMLDWSYNLLSKHEQVVLSRLSVFVGHFTLQAACTVSSNAGEDDGDVSGIVASLVAKSLISITGIDGSTYYRLFDTTRAYASARLAELGETDRMRRQHAIYFARFLKHDKIIQSMFGVQNLSGYTPHIGNVRAALEWAMSDQGDGAVGIELAAWAAPLFVGLSLLEECRRWSEGALAALDDTSRGSRHEMILQEALAVSLMYTRGHSDQVGTAIERGLALAEALQDHVHQLRFAGLNLFFVRFGDVRRALAIVERGGPVTAAKLPAGAVWMEWMLGIAHHSLGNQATAQLHYERGLALAAEFRITNLNLFGFDQRVAVLVGYARVLWLRGFADRAARVAQAAMDEAASQGNPISVCISQLYAATVFLWAGDLPRAGDVIEQLFETGVRYSLGPYRAASIGLRGELAVARDDPQVGIELLRAALNALQAEQYNRLTLAFMGALADGLRKTGQFEDALRTIDGAVENARSSGVTSHLSELLRIKAQILASMPGPDPRTAMDCLAEALSVARAQSAPALELRSAIVLARLLAESGQRDRARHVLSSVYDGFTEGFETTNLRVARRFIKDLA